MASNQRGGRQAPRSRSSGLSAAGNPPARVPKGRHKRTAIPNADPDPRIASSRRQAARNLNHAAPPSARGFFLSLLEVSNSVAMRDLEVPDTAIRRSLKRRSEPHDASGSTQLRASAPPSREAEHHCSRSRVAIRAMRSPNPSRPNMLKKNGRPSGQIHAGIKLASEEARWS